MTELPLAHRRVVMTRAVDQIEPLAQRLRALGVEPIALSLIDIAEPSDGGAALRDALETLATFDWLVLSSPNGAVRVAEALQQLGEHRPLVAAVGTATAAATTTSSAKTTTITSTSTTITSTCTTSTATLHATTKQLPPPRGNPTASAVC